MSRRRYVSSLTLALLALLAGRPTRAQAPESEAQIKAAFVYNFLKFVEWPRQALEHADDPLVVAIVGRGAMADATEKFLDAKQVGGRRVVVRRFKWDESLTGANAVLVTETDSRKILRVLETIASGAILSIGEGSAFASNGGVITLVIENRKVRFDIDVGAANAAGLKVSSKLLALTRVVHPEKSKETRP